MPAVWLYGDGYRVGFEALRGVTLSGIRSSMVLLTDEELWKSRLGAYDADHADLAHIDTGGPIRWTNSTAFSAP